MMVLKCKMCGGDIELSPDKTYGVCNHCGNNTKLSEIKDEQKLNLKNITDNMASVSLERLIQNSNTYLELVDYPSAQEVFRRITKDYPEDYRGWWGLIVCETRGFEVIKEDLDSINKWFKNVIKLAPAEDLSMHNLEFEEYIRNISEVDFDNEIVKVNGIVRNMNEILNELNSFRSKIEQDRGEKNKSYSNEIMIRNQAIDVIVNPFSQYSKNRVSNYVKMAFGIMLVLGIYSTLFEIIREKELSTALSFIFPIIVFIGSNFFLPFAASFLPAGLMLFFYNNETASGVGVNILLFGSIATFFSYRKSKKKKNAEKKNIENEKEALKSQYESYKNSIDKQIEEINNKISEVKNIINNCKKYLDYDKNKILDMFFAWRCSDFGVTRQFDSEIEELRDEIIDASMNINIEINSVDNDKNINSIQDLTDTMNLIMTKLMS